MDRNELLPCPFCGAVPEFETTTDPLNECNCVRCEDCDFDLMGGPVGIGWWPTPEAAAKAWNTRAAPPPPAEQASGGHVAEARELLAAELDAIRFPAMAAEVRDPEGYNSCGAAMVRAVARVIAALSQRPVVDEAMKARTRDWLATHGGYWDDNYVTRLLTAALAQQPEKGEG